MTTLNDIVKETRTELSAEWELSFGSMPPRGISQGLMRHVLAYERQRVEHGDLDAKSKRALRVKAHQKPSVPSRRRQHPQLQAGGRLIRDWNGKAHVVDVPPNGFEWRGKPYRSLSAIAKAITGAHWSGPRFFGLDKQASSHG